MPFSPGCPHSGNLLQHCRVTGSWHCPTAHGTDHPRRPTHWRHHGTAASQRRCVPILRFPFKFFSFLKIFLTEIKLRHFSFPFPLASPLQASRVNSLFLYCNTRACMNTHVYVQPAEPVFVVCVSEPVFVVCVYGSRADHPAWTASEGRPPGKG